MTLNDLLNKDVQFTEEEMAIIKGIDPMKAQFAELVVGGASKEQAYITCKQNADITPSSARKQGWIWFNSKEVQIYVAYLKSITREFYGNELNEVFQHMLCIALGTKQSVTTTRETDYDGRTKTIVQVQDDSKLQFEASRTILGLAGISVQQSNNVGTPQLTLVDDI